MALAWLGLEFNSMANARLHSSHSLCQLAFSRTFVDSKAIHESPRILLFAIHLSARYGINSTLMHPPITQNALSRANKSFFPVRSARRAPFPSSKTGEYYPHKNNHTFCALHHHYQFLICSWTEKRWSLSSHSRALITLAKVNLRARCSLILVPELPFQLKSSY